MRKRGEQAILELDLPFADKDDLELGQHDDELLIRVGPYRRSLLLPDSLRRRTVTAASLRDGRLKVTFAPERRASTSQTVSASR